MLSAERGNIANAEAAAVRDLKDAERRRIEAVHEAKLAEGDVAHYEAMSRGLDLEILRLEDELKRDYPGEHSADKPELRKRARAGLRGVKAEKLAFDNAALAATVAQGQYEQLAEDAKAARDIGFATALAHKAAKQPAEDAFEAAKLLKARVNPRLPRSRNRQSLSHRR